MYHPNLVFVEERPDFHTPLQQTNEQTLTTSKQKKLNLLTITFLTDYLMNKGKSWYIILSSMRVNNTFRKIIDCFWRKFCGDSPCQTRFVVFQKCTCVFLFSYALSNWQLSDCDIQTKKAQYDDEAVNLTQLTDIENRKIDSSLAQSFKSRLIIPEHNHSTYSDENVVKKYVDGRQHENLTLTQ